MSLLFPKSILQGPRRRAAPVSLLWVAFGVSLLVHLVALFVWWPDIFPKDKNDSAAGMGNSMRVVIAPPPAPAVTPQPDARRPAPPVPAEPPAARRAPPPAPAPRPPPVITRSAPEAPSPSVQSQPAPAPPAPEGDLSSMIEARRRARAQNAPTPPAPADDDIARRDRIVASNMSTIRSPTLGQDPKRSGGVFQVRRLGAFDAEFMFFGWNKDVDRQMSQVIEVRIGNNRSIELAVVRRMIAIVREYEKEDFSWQSARLGRVVTVSARAADNAGLEEFLMREFFDAGRPAR